MTEPSSRTEPPLAPRRRQTSVVHGITLVDDYAWLRDPSWQEVMREPERLDPEIRAYLEGENRWTNAVLAPTDGLRQQLFQELKGRLKDDDASVPLPDGPWQYYSRFRQGGQHPLLCRQPRDSESGEEMLLDCDRLAEGKAFFDLHAAAHSPDHRLLAYAVDEAGSEYCRIRIRDLASDRDLPEVLVDGSGDLAWSNDGRFLFYVVLDAQHRPCKVLRHRIGSEPADDVLIYQEADAGFFLGLSTTSSRRFIVVSAHDHVTSELHLIDADLPESSPQLVAPRVAEERYSLEHDAPRNCFLILTNREGAEDFKLMEAPEDRPGRESWSEILPHEAGRLRLDLLLLRDHLILLERRHALPCLFVMRLSDGARHEVAFDEAAYALGLVPGYEYDTASLRFVYSSPTTPQRTWDYDLNTRARVLRKEQEVPSGHNPADYVVERLEAPAEDGEKIPITLLRHRSTALDGAAPLLLYGYGSYGLSIPAAFQPNRLSLVNRGFIHAVAHIRGGTDKGWAWYRSGKLEHKENSFSDFTAAARHLIAEGYTQQGRIAIQGGSAGGMLVGTVLNRAPELFHAAVAEVPFVDVLNTMLDASLPLTPPEWNEWGNPLESPQAFERIRGYCPYQNVAKRPYPHILVTAGLTDPRVTYWEPAKWVAKLRSCMPAERQLLLKTYMSAGHAGAAGRFDKLEEVALVYAFLLLVFDMTEQRALTP
ncbi:S9 family peptidase [Aquibaculum arenosum]|uniref:S9 family peptidase n=1 Tax=Aquibaculum arenosum TaxID=3032591 RepID=A0ABT5YN26_9PROT|nr:S9 family peptidase [Fodinicurvata sp. CAU 1616]MDF2096237.1 S9 family peptidase [Fodinicurvata sp. CAU 1616]